MNVVLSTFGFLLTAAYWPGSYGAATSPRWAVLMVGLPLLLLVTRPNSSMASFYKWGLLFLAWAAVSLLWTTNVYDGVWALVVYALAAQAFVLGGRLGDLRPLAIGLGIGVAASCAVVTYQMLNSMSPVGLFINPADLGEAAALVLVLLCVYRLWWLALPSVAVLLVSGSRAGFLAVGVAGLTALWQRDRRWGALAAVPVVIGLVAVGLQRPGTVVERFAIWSEMAQGFSWFGNGLGSFATSFPYLTTTIDTLLHYPEHAHNDLLEIVFELGIFGLVLAALGAMWLCTRRAPESVVVAAFVAMALVDFPAHRPVTLLVAMVVAGHVVVRWDRIRRLAAYGRSELHDWDQYAQYDPGIVYSTSSISANSVSMGASVSHGRSVDRGGVCSNAP